MSTYAWVEGGAERRFESGEGGPLVGAWWRRRGAAGRSDGSVELRRALERDATLRLRPGPGGAFVRCLSGVLLVTQAGDPADHVLTEGDEVRLEGRGLAVAWALSEAVLVAGRP